MLFICYILKPILNIFLQFKAIIDIYEMKSAKVLLLVEETHWDNIVSTKGILIFAFVVSSEMCFFASS